MSKPSNPLDVFRSYSYHHILIVCDGTETADKISATQDLTTFNHNADDTRYCPKQIKGGDGKYVVLINGMTDTQFTISSAKWASVLIPNDKTTGENNTHFRTMAVDGELNITEPLGVNFLNLLNDASINLGTDANGLVFVLKTIFVGHNDQGKIEYVADIRGLQFIMYDIVSMFDVTGAEYVIAFVGVANGASRLPRANQVVNGFSFQVNADENMDKTIRRLFTELNEHYDKIFTSITSQAKTDSVPLNYKEQFIEVEYAVSLDDTYAVAIPGSANSTKSSTTGGPDTVVKPTVSNMSIESMLTNLLSSSQQVIDADQKEGPEGERYAFKITSNVETGPDKYKVHYNVVQSSTPVIKAEKFYDFEPPKGSGIQFEYIFTGKNIDIIDFDIKMNMGMAFFQTLNVQGNERGVGATQTNPASISGGGQSNGATEPTQQSKCVGTPTTRKKPFFLGDSVTSAVTRSKKSPVPHAAYNALLARWAAYESLEASMKIRGNPQLLSETTQTADELNPNITTSAVVVDLGQHDPSSVWASPHTTPAYCKVDVFMPNVMQGLDDTNVYASNFWYPGWYFVYAINHVFDNGEFTQELEMFSLPTDASESGLGKTDASSKTTSETT